MQNIVLNQLAAIRKSRGFGASDLAGRVGVSRQTIYAIEAGTYVPNTEVTLKLARVLEVRVEELFRLAGDEQEALPKAQAELLSASPAHAGQPVRVCPVDDRLIAVPVSAVPSFLPEADGLIAGTGAGTQAELSLFAREEAHPKKLVLAGCDPAIGLMSRVVEKLGGIDIVPAAASSRLALSWLKQGKVHIAGSHLKDPATGEFNLPFVRRELKKEDCAVITFASWEQGFVMKAGAGVKSVADLAGPGRRFMNREPGSGSRALFDQLLEQAGIATAQINGYDDIAYGHLAAAYAVSTGQADCCLATRSAANAFDLDFTPLQTERYDFVMRRQTLDTPIAQIFMDVLQRASLRRKLELLAGYDTTGTGAALV